MSRIDPQTTLRADGCGTRLRDAREAAGLTLEQVGARLKMPVRVLQAIEGEQWETLGAPVFVRGQLRSYARLVGIDINPLIESAGIGGVEPARLVSHVHTPPLQRLFEQAGRRLVYVVMTAVIVVPVWMMATRGPVSDTTQQESALLDTPATAGPQPPQEADPSARATVAASMAPMPARPATAAALSIRFTGNSWFEVVGPDGVMIEQGLAATGSERSYSKGQVARIVVGNVSAVEVLSAGHPVDLAPYRRANVVRFAVSSEGALVPSAN